MPRPVDISARQETTDSIKAIARQQMIENGTAGISLRGIAREMGMTAPAIYNYFPRLEDLITALLVDAFNGLGDAIDEAIAKASSTSEKIRDGANAYRGWANDHKADFQLIYGNPIPNYEAPREVTVPLATRPLVSFYRCLMDAYQEGQLSIPPEYASVPESISSYVSGFLHPQYPQTKDMPMSLYYLLTVLWTRIHGVVMLEIFGHLEPSLGDVDSFFEGEITVFLKNLGLL
jgi:AcrR family transcriptional regulator